MNKLLLTGICMGGSLLGTNEGFSQKQSDSSNQKDKLNVLFIFVDDMTYNGLNALGNKEIISPNMDKLINSGVSFTNTYNMGGWNGAISVASRAQLLTGLYLWNAHESEKKKYEDLVENRQIWSEVMEDAGYKTFHTGKWHMNHLNAEDVFQKAEVVRGGMPPTCEGAYNRPLSRDDKAWEPWDTNIPGFWTEKGHTHWSEVLADVTVQYLNENKDSMEPLFMFCAFNAPHDPRQSPKEYVDMYDVNKVTLPESYLPLHPYYKEMACSEKLRDERLAPFPRTEYAVKKHLQEYYAIITHLDVQIGKILEALEKNGMTENTLIVFAADNGLAMGKHGLIGKQNMYDHSVKVPLVFSGCGLPEGQSRDQLVYLQDLVPTIYDLVGIDSPEGVEFISQLDVLKDKNAEGEREAVYAAYLDVQRMVRNERYKLFFIPRAKQVYLFDLKKDPEEITNLYGQKKYNKIVKKLANIYLELAKESGDTYKIEEIYPEIFN